MVGGFCALPATKTAIFVLTRQRQRGRPPGHPLRIEPDGIDLSRIATARRRADADILVRASHPNQDTGFLIQLLERNRFVIHFTVLIMIRVDTSIIRSIGIPPVEHQGPRAFSVRTHFDDYPIQVDISGLILVLSFIKEHEHHLFGCAQIDDNLLPTFQVVDLTIWQPNVDS